MTDSDLIERYLSYLRVERGISIATTLAYRTDLEKLALFAKTREKQLLTLEKRDITDLMKNLNEEGLGPRSIRRWLSCIRGLYKFALIDRITAIDPTADISMPKVWSSLPRVLNATEVTAICEVSNGDRGVGGQ